MLVAVGRTHGTQGKPLQDKPQKGTIQMYLFSFRVRGLYSVQFHKNKFNKKIEF